MVCEPPLREKLHNFFRNKKTNEISFILYKEIKFNENTYFSEINGSIFENTKLANAMFVNSGIETIDIYEKIQIPSFAFAKCANLKTVNIHNDFNFMWI